MKQEMNSVWASKFQVKVDAAAKEMAGKMAEEELKTQLDKLETQLREQLEEQRLEIAKRVEGSRVVPFKKCGRCKLVSYCSAVCQKEDWRAHSSYCVEKKNE